MDPNSNISRWVSWLLMPLATAAGGFIALKARTWFGLDIDPAEATAYALGLMLAIASGFLLWVRNRGKYEIARVFGLDPEEVERLEVMGKLGAAQMPPPRVTPEQAILEARARERQALIENGVRDADLLDRIAPWPLGAEARTRTARILGNAVGVGGVTSSLPGTPEHPMTPET